MRETLARIIDKFLSARFIVTLSIITTYCVVVVGSLYLAVKDKLSIEAFLGLFVGFSTLATMIVKSYFERNDRITNEPPK